jgi:HlyD family secretion protein
MDKKVKYILGFSLMGAALLGTIGFLIIKSRPQKIEHQTIAVERRTIENKIIASGSIIPELEVEVKSSLSGVVDQIFVEAGDWVEKGAPLLSIQVIPNSLDLNSSQAALERSRILLQDAQLELQRMTRLHDSRSVSDVDYNQALMAYQLAQQNYNEANNRISLIKEGHSLDDNSISNQIFAPISGVVLALPLKKGAPVQEQGGMSTGTTIAYMADMNSLYFSGSVDEAQVGKLKVGLPVNLTVAALENSSIEGQLDFISPRGDNSSGSVLFPIEISFEPQDNRVLRAGYSASGEIILDSAQDVLAVQERDVIMEEGKNYVEILQDRETQRVEITLGISDGIYTEVSSGLVEGDLILVQ